MLEDYFFTKNIKWVLWGTFAVVLALLIFHAGVVVGSHEPRGRMNGAPNGQFMNGQGPLGSIMPTQGYVEDAHGAVGTIATVTLPTFTMQSRDGMTEKIYAGTSTVVTGGTMPNTGALKGGLLFIVIGDPGDTDDGYLEARIIHILPSLVPQKQPANNQ